MFGRIVVMVMMVLFLSNHASETLATIRGDEAGAGLVGAVPAVVSVQPSTGSVSTSFEFAAPPGRAAIQPDLRILYNSSGNAPGPLGRGWRFAIPFIQRSTRFGQPRFDLSDAFSLFWGGGLLDLTVFAEPGGGVREFRTEVESYLRIRSIGTGTAMRWEVEDGRGTKYEFGNTAASPNSSIPEFHWTLNRIQDQNGNYLTIDYLSDTTGGSGAFFPKRILYTGNQRTGLQPSNVVEFVYEGRHDNTVGYLGKKVNIVRRLKRIRTFAGAQLASLYLLGYNSPGTGVHDVDLCLGVSCGFTTVSCSGGGSASCNQTCDPNTGFCQACTPTCGGSSDGGDGDGKGRNRSTRWGPDGPPGNGAGGRTADAAGSGRQDPAADDATPLTLLLVSTSSGPALPGYSAESLPSLLTSITRYDATGGTWLPRTTYGYTGHIPGEEWNDLEEDVPEPFLFKECKADGTRNTDDYGVQVEDVNGDGLPDIVRGYSCRLSYLPDDFCGIERRTYINTGSGWAVPDPAWEVPEDFVIHRLEGEESPNGLVLLDINNDGLPDLVRSVMEPTEEANCVPSVFKQSVWLNNGHGWTPAPEWQVPIPFAEVNLCDDGAEFDLGVRFGDVNGDGFVDLVKRYDYGDVDSPETRFQGVWLNTGTGWVQQSGWKVPEPFVYHFPGGDTVDPGTRLLDVNGDGLADVVRSVQWLGSTYNEIWLASRTPDASGFIWRAGDEGFSSWDWWIPERFTVVTTEGNGRSFDQGVRFADVDGDARVDLVVARSLGTPEQYVYLHTGGKRWQYHPGLSDAIPAGMYFVEHIPGAEDYDMGVRLSDLDGNGAADWVRSIDDCGAPRRERHMSRVSFSHLLAAVDNGIGGSTRLTYRPAAGIDNRAPGAILGDRAFLNFPMAVLTSATRSDGQTGTGHTFATTYAYRGGFYHYARREFRGFRYVRTDLPGSHRYLEQLFVQDRDLPVAPLTGSVEREVLRRTSAGPGSEGPVFSLTVSEFDRSDVSAPFLHWLRAQDAYLFDWTTGGTIEAIDTEVAVEHTRSESHLTFDGTANGFVLARETRALGDVADPGDDLYQTADLVNEPTAWRVGLPYRQTLTDAPGGTGTILARAWMYYDGQTQPGGTPTEGRLTRAEVWSGQAGDGPGSAGNPATTYQYHPDYGHLTAVTDAEGHTANLAYGETDPTYTYIDRRWAVTTGSGTPATHETRYRYDPRLGLPIETSGPDGSRFAEFDFFGRPTRSWTSETGDGATAPRVCVTYDLGARPVQVVTYWREAAGLGDTCGTLGMVGTAAYYDGLGRMVQAQEEGATQASPVRVASSVAFDGEGNVASTYQPFFGASPTFAYQAPGPSVPSTTIEYDAAGRVARTVQPGVPPTLTTYSGRVTTRWDPERPLLKQWEKETDAFGRVREGRTYDDSGAIYTRLAYEHDRQGRLEAIVDSANNRIEYVHDFLGRLRATSDPDAGTLTYDWYRDGQLKSVSDPVNGTTTYRYDELHRALEKTRGDLTRVLFHHDEPAGRPGGPRPIGHLTSIDDERTGFRQALEYDLLGRARVSLEWIDGGAQPYRIERTPDALGRLRSLTFPDNSTVHYLYGSDGRLSDVVSYTYYPDGRIKDTIPFATGITYWKTGAPAGLDVGNGLGVSFTYEEPTQRLRNIHAGTASRPVLDITVGYTPVGYVQGLTDGAGTATQSFVLDHQYRLLQATAPDSYGRLDFEHDAIGNLTLKGPVRFIFEQPAQHPHRATSTSDGRRFLYNDVGSLREVVDASSGGLLRDLRYDPDGRLTRVRDPQVGTITEHLYDPQGSRVLRKESSDDGQSFATTVLLGNLYEETGTSYKKFVRAGAGVLVEWRSDGSRYFHIGDHLGSTSVITDEGRHVVQRIEYRPYGEISALASEGFSDGFMFAGARRDALTGLYDFGARFYDPTLGRFLTVDPILPDPMDFRDLNPYAYARGNPVSMLDVGGAGSAFPAIMGMLVTLGASHIPGCAGPCAGAIGGAVSGALGAQESGGDVLRGAAYGAAIGGLVGGIFKGESVTTLESVPPEAPAPTPSSAGTEVAEGSVDAASAAAEAAQTAPTPTPPAPTPQATTPVSTAAQEAGKPFLEPQYVKVGERPPRPILGQAAGGGSGNYVQEWWKQEAARRQRDLEWAYYGIAPSGDHVVVYASADNILLDTMIDAGSAWLTKRFLGRPGSALHKLAKMLRVTTVSHDQPGYRPGDAIENSDKLMERIVELGDVTSVDPLLVRAPGLINGSHAGTFQLRIDDYGVGLTRKVTFEHEYVLPTP
jgi:RHS repeat-associated protein